MYDIDSNISDFLILTPSDLDSKFISPLRNKNEYKLNEWRNIFAEKIGFKSFQQMSQRDYVLLHVWDAYAIIDSEYDDDFYRIAESETKWVIPKEREGSLCARVHRETATVSPKLEKYYGDGRWHPHYNYINLGNFCISKRDAKEIIDIISYGTRSLDEVQQLGERYGVERRSPDEYWATTSDYKARQTLVKCKTKNQLYAEICNFVGPDGDYWFGNIGLSLSEFIQEILDDDDCTIGK
jgi:hypothetical protein